MGITMTKTKGSYWAGLRDHNSTGSSALLADVSGELVRDDGSGDNTIYMDSKEEVEKPAEVKGEKSEPVSCN